MAPVFVQSHGSNACQHFHQCKSATWCTSPAAIAHQCPLTLLGSLVLDQFWVYLDCLLGKVARSGLLQDKHVATVAFNGVLLGAMYRSAELHSAQKCSAATSDGGDNRLSVAAGFLSDGQ